MFYRSFSAEVRRRFGEKLYKLSLDGGMSCPNRDGTLGYGGCIFCSGGSGEFAEGPCPSVEEQLEKAKARVAFKTEGKGRYIAYFQSYTNTYAPVERLRELFEPVIQRDDIAVLDIATRPDCLGWDVLELLSELNGIKPVWVELGLQTIHESTANYIRRGYTLEVYDRAVAELKARGIEVIVHMILGLPGETDEMIYDTASYIAKSGADGIKLQLLHVLRGTALAAEYEAGRFEALSLEHYTELLEGCISRLRPDMTVHRITGDGAKRELIAPMWSTDKKKVLSYINSAFERDALEQGSLFCP
ncbi:MAG: TIGR01212 family radical SAM protein [Clostridiales bacterium]|nr:TIGR01212 family radical SAM protein [Clostridiales bacterium]